MAWIDYFKDRASQLAMLLSGTTEAGAALPGRNADGSMFVGGKTAIIVPTVTVTAGAYHANDCVGAKITLTSAARVSGYSTSLVRVAVLDAAGQKAQLELLFWNANPADSTFTDNNACVIHANDEAKYLGKVTIYATDYLTVGAKAVASVAVDNLPMTPNGSANLFMTMLTPGTPTYVATTDLKMALAFYQD